MTALAFAGNSAGYLTCKEASAYLPLHWKTIQRMCTAGDLEHLTLGNRHLIHRDVIAAWIRAHTTPARKRAVA